MQHQHCSKSLVLHQASFPLPCRTELLAPSEHCPSFHSPLSDSRDDLIASLQQLPSWPVLGQDNVATIASVRWEEPGIPVRDKTYGIRMKFLMSFVASNVSSWGSKQFFLHETTAKNIERSSRWCYLTETGSLESRLHDDRCMCSLTSKCGNCTLNILATVNKAWPSATKSQAKLQLLHCQMDRQNGGPGLKSSAGIYQNVF